MERVGAGANGGQVSPAPQTVEPPEFGRGGALAGPVGGSHKPRGRVGAARWDVVRFGLLRAGRADGPAQPYLVDLSDAGTRQRGHDLDPLGHPPPWHPFAQVGEEGVPGLGRALAEDHDGQGALLPAFVRHGHHGRVDDRGMGTAGPSPGPTN